MSITFFTLVSVFFSGNVCAQLTHIKFQVRVGNVQSDMGDEDGPANDSDFQWEYSGTSNGSPAISGNGCYEIGGNDNPNVNINNVFMNQTNPTTATSVTAQWRARENDDGDCSDDDECRMSTFMTQTINVRSGSPCTWNNSLQMTSPAYCGGNYRLTFAHYWEPVANSPSSITESATGMLCVGSSRTLTAVFTDEATSGVAAETRWYTSACSTTGHFATGNSITVNPSSTTTYYARRVITSTCGSGNFSVNCASITITVGGPAPSLVNAGSDVTICAGSSVQLNGSATAPNACSVLGTGSLTNPSCNGVYTYNAATDNDHILNFSTSGGITNIANNGSGYSANSYGDFTGLIVSVLAGNSFGISVFAGTSWNHGFRIWIDWNNDGVFQGTESMWSAGTGTATYTGSILVPATQAAGKYRMRVRCVYNAIPGVGDACTTYGYGEVEDYTLQVNRNDGPCTVTYAWSPATFLSATNVANPTASNVTAPQTYTMTATANGCTSAPVQVTVTVNPNLPASVSISASPNTNICLGTTVTFTATPTNGGTTPSYQWKVNGGNVGTNSTTFASSSLVNGDVVTCVLTSNATPCLTGSPATSTGITMSIQASGSPLSGNESKTCVVNGNDWVRFYGSTGLLLGAIRANNNNLGNVTMQTLVSTPGVMNACAQPSNPLYSTVYMGRTWVMNSSAYPSGANFPSNVTVRLPFNNSELTSLNSAADASTTGNPNDGGTTIPATLANLMLTKITGATENGVANAADCASTILGITANAGTGTNYLSIASTSYIDFNVGQFSEFFLHKNNAGMPLPVELISFSGTCTEKGTELTWQTASESNNDYFIVQRSRDGQNWEDLTTVSGNGNSTQLINYDWLDEAGFDDLYYRLTQVDFNGDRYEKQAIYVNCESESTKLNVYPNPTQSDFTVEVNSTKEVESATISIIDVTGKALTHRNVEIHSGINTFNFGNQLESGTYLIRVSIEGEIQTLRLVVKN